MVSSSCERCSGLERALWILAEALADAHRSTDAVGTERRDGSDGEDGFEDRRRLGFHTNPRWKAGKARDPISILSRTAPICIAYLL